MNRIALSLSLAASSIAFGQVLAYEPFEYPAGNLSGKDGGIGFAEAWQQDIRTNDVGLNSIEIPGVTASGGRVIEGGRFAESLRTLAANPSPADPDNPVATEVWFSVHAMMNENNEHDPFTECFAGVTLVRENGDEALRLGQAWSDGVWGYSQPNISDVRSTVNIDTTPRLIVARIVDPGTGLQDAEVHAWIDPDVTAGEPLNENAFGTSLIYGGGFNRVKVHAGNYGSATYMMDVDEIKLGTSFEEVTTGTPSIAYEGFDYTPETINSTMNGGTGFSGPWSDATPVNRPSRWNRIRLFIETLEAQGEQAEMVLVRSATSTVPTAPPVNQRRFTTH